MTAVFDTADPVFDATPGPTTFVAAGYAATLRRQLRPGQHVIAGEVAFSNGDPPVTFTIMLNVTRGGHGD